jgi:hypothetical protein
MDIKFSVIADQTDFKCIHPERRFRVEVARRRGAIILINVGFNRRSSRSTLANARARSVQSSSWRSRREGRECWRIASVRAVRSVKTGPRTSPRSPPFAFRANVPIFTRGRESEARESRDSQAKSYDLRVNFSLRASIDRARLFKDPPPPPPFEESTRVEIFNDFISVFSSRGTFVRSFVRSFVTRFVWLCSIQVQQLHPSSILCPRGSSSRDDENSIFPRNVSRGGNASACSL